MLTKEGKIALSVFTMFAIVVAWFMWSLWFSFLGHAMWTFDNIHLSSLMVFISAIFFMLTERK